MRTAPTARGYVYLVALFVLLVAMTAALLVAASLHQQSWLYRQERQSVELMARLDAGLALALSRLYADPDFKGSAEVFGDSPIVVEVARIDGLNVEVTVKATHWGGARAARAEVNIDRGPRETRRPPRVRVWEPLVYRPEEESGGGIVGRN